MRLPLVCLFSLSYLVQAGCAGLPELLADGDRRLAAGDSDGARAAYARAARRAATGSEPWMRARVGTALADEKRGDLAAARRVLEALVDQSAPGVEAALYHLARIIEPEDRPRALGFYYRAAAAAQRRGGGFPYREATQRLVGR